MNFKNISKGLGLLTVFLTFTKESQAKFTFSIIDSIGVENNDGKQVVLHRLESKETYYSLSRRYVVQPKEIIAFNNNKSLKIGDIVRIPTNRVFISTIQVSNAKPDPIISSASSDNSIQYRVGAGETLYTIAKRFQVTVAQIVQKNNLRSEQDIKAGQTILIPQASLIERTVQQPEEPEETEIIEEKQNTLPSNRYGLRQVDEKGVGVWMDGLNAEGGNMLALHKTAPVGTVVKITNPMTQKTTFAKIVGRYTDNSNTRDAVIVISKATANLLGILDKRFLINISYGMPVN